VALALRFDYHLATTRTPIRPSERYPKRYFTAVFIAYVFGLSTTIFVMHTFKAAQPALLYLSPACVGSVFGLAWWRGEMKELTGYKDGDEEEGEDKKAEKKEKKKIAQDKEE
jgi:minor histocompatibility antigen H13